MEKRITACVVIIGNEILSGRTQDLNLSYLGKRCDELGIYLDEARVIADNEESIISTVDECRQKYTYVFTTGGIGPTHDDITSASIARLFHTELERNPTAVAAMDQYYEPGKLNEARLKMADIPVGADLIDNPVSGAPGYQLENVFVLPGVPLIMQAMFEGITDRLTGGVPVITKSVITNLTEGTLAEGLGKIQEQYADVSIGSYPFFRRGKLGVNIIMRTSDQDRIEIVHKAVKELVSKLKGEMLN